MCAVYNKIIYYYLMASFEWKVVWFSVGLVVGNHRFDSKLKLQFTHTLFSLMPPSLPAYCCGIVVVLRELPVLALSGFL